MINHITIGNFEFPAVACQYVYLPSPFFLKPGQSIEQCRLGYETFGKYDPTQNNVIVVFPGLSPNTHICSSPEDSSVGWWENVAGEGKHIDTKKYYVIVFNHLGSCKGSSGPVSINPSSGEPHSLLFPMIDVNDMARAVYFALQALGVSHIHCLIGLSMGG